MQRKIKEFTSYITKFSKKAIWVLAIGAAGTSVAQTQSELGPNYFGTPMFSYWEEADLAKSGTKGYFGGRLTLPHGAEKWPEEFREQLKQYKISHFASRETIHENEVPDEIKSFPYYELPTLSTESVKIQMKRVAREREITEEQLEELVNKHEKKSQWAVFIDPWINIQELNRDLDQVFPFPIPEPKPVEVAKTNNNAKKKVQVVIRKPKSKVQTAKTTKTATASKAVATSKTAKTTKTVAKTSIVSKKSTKQAANKTTKTVKG